jgi:hypothetical protein
MIEDLFSLIRSFIFVFDRKKIRKTEHESYMNLFTINDNGFVVQRAFFDHNFFYNFDSTFLQAEAKDSFYYETLIYQHGKIKIKHGDAVAHYNSEGILVKFKNRRIIDIDLK